MSTVSLMALALLFEAGLGWPGWLYDRIRHPVVWIGALVSLLDAKLNSESASDFSRKLFGVLAMLMVVAVTVAISTAISLAMPNSFLGHVAEALVASSLLASRSLYRHIAAVINPLAAGDLPTARIAVGQIVGRDPAHLDSPAIARASIESLAENASDGVVAPLFWGALFGLPGIAAYKAINTLDSMIGHRTPRYSSFGWASARTDDLINYLPARITALAFSVAARSMTSLRTAYRDARLHRSPNAGWPESALAGALNIRVSGPRVYDGRRTDEPWVNGECSDPDHNSIRDGLRLYVGAMILIWMAMISAALIGAYPSLDHEADEPGVQAIAQKPMKSVANSEQPEALDKTSAEGFSFDCGPEGTADVRFLGPDTVELSFASRSYVLPQERAASGAKYFADGVGFWNKGAEATIEIGKMRLTCNRS